MYSMEAPVFWGQKVITFRCSSYGLHLPFCPFLSPASLALFLLRLSPIVQHPGHVSNRAKRVVD